MGDRLEPTIASVRLCAFPPRRRERGTAGEAPAKKHRQDQMMTMPLRRSLFSLLFIAFLSSTHAVIPQRQHGMVGGYAPADVNDPFVNTVAQFAVDELEKNKKQYSFLAAVPADTHLKGTVVQAGMQVCVIYNVVVSCDL